MGKRSSFERIERDFYPTPVAAVLPLLTWLPQAPFTFAEPCAGAGSLIQHLEVMSSGRCIFAGDIALAALGIRPIVSADMFAGGCRWLI